MENSLKKQFDDLVFSRAFETATRHAMDDPRYIKREQEATQLSEEIIQLCGQERKFLIESLSDAIADVKAIEIEYAYLQGLKDGPSLLKELGVDVYSLCLIRGRDDGGHPYEQFRSLSGERKIKMADIMIDLFEEMEKKLELPAYVGIILSHAVSRLCIEDTEKEKAGAEAGHK